jgi:capsular exopolysaccharide synthesis family protein
MPRQGDVAVLIARKGRRARRIRGSLPPAPKQSVSPTVHTNGRSNLAFLQTPEVNLPPGREAAPVAAPARREPVRHVTIEGIGTAVAEAYGSLQTNIAYTTSDAPIKLLLITSSMPGEGKTTTAANLALTFAQRGLRVLLMDADLRRGTIHALFEGARSPGMTEVLRGTRQLSEVVRVLQLDEGEAMHYVPTGSLPSYPTQLLESEAMRELLTKARDQYDMVILDSPPVNMITDAAILGAHADGVLLVARAGRTASPALSYAMSQLGHVRARIVGAVLNDIDFKRDSVYDSSYQYYANARYTADIAK